MLELLGLLFGLMLLTAIGHGIWVFVAFLLRSLLGQPMRKRPESRQEIAAKEILKLREQGRIDEAQCRRLVTELTKPVVLSGRTSVSRRSDVDLSGTNRQPKLAQDSQKESGDTPQTAGAPFPATSKDEIVTAQIVASDEERSRLATQPSHPQVDIPPQSQPESLHARAQRYQTRRGKALGASASNLGRPVSKPRRTWQAWLGAFMEEKNIRWGELVGGLLIVSCSVALVISFWSAIDQRPLLKFGVLNGVTATLFAFGLYVAHRWRLPSTSQGILITASLLVPLNFLAIAAFSSSAPDAGSLAFWGEGVSIVLLGTLVFYAGRIIAPGFSTALSVGVMVPAVNQLLIRRFVGEESGLTLWAVFAGIALLGFWLAQSMAWLNVGRLSVIARNQAECWAKLLGISSFALLLCLGFLVVKTEHPTQAITWLSPGISLLSIPLLVIGVTLWFRPGTLESAWRFTGTSLASGSMLLVLLSLGIAWPQPVLIVCISVACAVAITALAAHWRLAELHVVPAGLLAIAGFLGLELLAGELTWVVSNSLETIQALSQPLSGHLLTGTAVALGLVSLLIRRYTLPSIAHAYQNIAVGVAGFGLLHVAYFGAFLEGDPHYFSAYLAIWGSSVVLVARRRASRILFSIGAGLLLAAMLHAMCFAPLPVRINWPWVDALLLHATLMVACLGVRLRGKRWLPESLNSTVVSWAALTSASAAVAGLLALAENASASIELRCVWLALVWLCLAWMQGSRAWFNAFQAALLAAVLLQVHHNSTMQTWFDAASLRGLEPAYLQQQGMALALFALAWSTARLFWRTLGGKPTRACSEADARWRANANLFWIERFSAFVALALLVGLAVYGVVPGVGQELAPQIGAERVVRAASDFHIFGKSHLPCQSWSTWVLLLVVALNFGCNQVQEFYFRVPTDSSAPTATRLSFARSWAAGYDQTMWFGLLATSALLPLLLAARWEPQVAVASALRWYCALYFVAASIVLWAQGAITRGSSDILQLKLPRSRSPDRLQSFLWLLSLSTLPVLGMAVYLSSAVLAVEPLTAAEKLQLAWLFALATLGAVVFLPVAVIQSGKQVGVSVLAGSLVVLTAMPALTMSLFVVADSLSGHPITGPESNSWFSSIGLALSYALPLAMICGGVVGHAIHLKSSPIAFAGGLLLNGTVTAGYLLSLKAGTLTIEQWIALSLLNSLSAFVFTAGWMFLAKNLVRRTLREIASEFWLSVMRSVAVGFLVVPLTWMILETWCFPDVQHSLAASISWMSWGAWALMAFLHVQPTQRDTRTWLPMPLWILGLIPPVVAMHLKILSDANWLAYHVMQVGWCLLGVLIVVKRRGQLNGIQIKTQLAELGPIVLLFLWGARGIAADPGGPWWSILALLGAACLAAELAARRGRQRYLIIAAVSICVAAATWWIEIGQTWSATLGTGRVVEFLLLQAIALALPIPLWNYCTRSQDSEPWRGTNNLLALTSTWASMFFVALSVGSGLLSDIASVAAPVEAWLHWAGWLSAGYASLALLWTRRRQAALGLLWVTGFVGSVALLDAFDLRPLGILWTATSALSVYGLLISYLWSYRERIRQLAVRLKLPPAVGSLRTQAWIVPLTLVLSGGVCLMGLLTQFTADSMGIRVTASQAILVQVWAIGLLSQGLESWKLRYVALCIGVVGAVALGWAMLDQTQVSWWMHRLVMLGAVLMGMAAFYSVGLVKLLRKQNEWTEAAGRLVPGLAALGSLAIVCVLGLEVAMYFADREVALAWPAVLTMALALTVTIAACLIAAVVPGRDPLGLSEKQRQVYVYLAEIAFVLLLLHLRVTMPFLFSDLIRRYWAIITMAIAFLGVGISEYCRRYRQIVVAEPLERTSVFLPLLPLLGFWLGEQGTHFSILLFATSGLYAVLSIMRRSIGFGLFAILAANGGLWYFWQATADIQFFVHPQVWLIPPALSLLVASYWNREQLSASHMTSIRYLASSTVYVASTADVFINGVGEAPWLPIVLAGLSIVGIFTGILLRVRAFLFMGLAFLVVSLLTVVWYAAVDLERTWIWYLTGIVTGVLVFAAFAILERKRQQVQEVVARIKTWEP